MKNKSSNIIFIILSVLWLGFFAKLLIFGEFELYVNPALKPLLWFMFIFFLVFCIFWIKNRWSMKFESKYLVFLVPFLLLFFTKPQPLGSQTLEKQVDSKDRSIKGGYYHINESEITHWKTLLNDLSDNKKPGMNRIWTLITDKNKEKVRMRNRQKEPGKNIKDAVLANLNDMLENKKFYDEKSFEDLKLDPSLKKVPEENNGKTAKQQLHRQNRKIMEAVFDGSLKEKKLKKKAAVTDPNKKPDYIVSKGNEFYTFWSQLEKEPDKYLGSKVRLKGRFFRKDEDFLPTQALLSRLVITCCAAHAIPAGIHVESDKIGDWKNDDWLIAEGVIDLAETEKGLLPVLEITDFEKVKSESPYIYPAKGAELPSLNLAGGNFKPINSQMLPIILGAFLILTFVVTVVGDNE